VFLCNIKVKTVSDHFVKKEKKNLCMVIAVQIDAIVMIPKRLLNRL
jgi:hypothetical protein